MIYKNQKNENIGGKLVDLGREEAKMGDLKFIADLFSRTRREEIQDDNLKKPMMKLIWNHTERRIWNRQTIHDLWQPSIGMLKCSLISEHIEQVA